jgi:hypothetical protein
MNVPAFFEIAINWSSQMAKIARLFSVVFPQADEHSDDAFPVLMFTAIGLAAVICFVLMNGAPPPIEVEVF